MVQCDVRQCPEDEVLLLFNKMTQNKPTKVRYDEGHTHLTYKFGICEYRVWVRPTDYMTFEFYTGRANIRFDGELVSNQHYKDVLMEHSKDGKGTKVSDYINLKSVGCKHNWKVVDGLAVLMHERCTKCDVKKPRTISAYEHNANVTRESLKTTFTSGEE